MVQTDFEVIQQDWREAVSEESAEDYRRYAAAAVGVIRSELDFAAAVLDQEAEANAIMGYAEEAATLAAAATAIRDCVGNLPETQQLRALAFYDGKDTGRAETIDHLIEYLREIR
jgi:hypothetical protein